MNEPVIPRSNTSTHTQQWLRYWRNSLADAESGRGALSRKDLAAAHKLDSRCYGAGCLPSDSPILAALFEGEEDTTQLVRAVIRPAIYLAVMERGVKPQALYPDVLTPLICTVWVARDGRLLPAEPPVIPRDLLQPQADDRFTVADAAELDRFLTISEPRVYTESEAVTLLDTPEHKGVWTAYYEVSRALFDKLCPKNVLRTAFVSADEARILKVDEQLGAAHHIVALYDWLSTVDKPLPVLDTYALKKVEQYQACESAVGSMVTRLGHANTQYPLAIAQRDALAQVLAMDEGELLAVNGPPGTGKTTFVLSAVASLWVKAALDQGEPPLIIAASTNNQAVTNILEAFAKGFEQGKGAFGGRWLPDITSYGGYYPARSRETDAAQHYQTTSFYRQTETPEYIAQAEERFLQRARDAFNDDALNGVEAVKSQLHQRLEAAFAQLKSLQQHWQAREAWQAQLEALLGEAPEVALAQAASSLEELQAKYRAMGDDLTAWRHFCANESIWLALLSVLPPVAKKRRLKRLLFIDEQFSAQARDIIGQDGSSSLVDPELLLQRWLSQQQEAIERQQRFIVEAHQLQRQIEEAQTLLEAAYSAVQTGMPLPRTFDEFDQTLDTSLRFQLFQLAVHYWEARWLEECDERHDELVEQAAKGKEKPGLKKVQPRWRRRMKLTPCIVSTLHSLPSHMTYKVFEGEGRFRDDYLINEIDLLIIDEAGQVAPDVAGASMALAKRALAIGDVHQIKPVSTQLHTVDVGNLSHQGLIAALDEYDDLRENGRSVVDGSVMRIAQAASQYHYLSDAEPGMFLREHRRCLNSIISFCNDLCYWGLLQPLRSSPATDPELPPFGYVHVDGRAETPPSGSRVNRLEAITIAEWLATQRDSLEQAHGAALENIVGVVTPFKAQANLIEQECRARGISVGRGDAEMTVGTVHALQGAERAIVIFSAVYSRHADGAFIDQDPSLLNVAVSRAKDSFLVFGDMDVIGTAARGTPRHLLGRYLFSSEGNELAFTASVARPDLLALCPTPKMINNAEEHDQCLKELLENVQHRLAMVSPWLSLECLETTGLLSALQQAAERGVAVTIYTDSHFNTTIGNQLDESRKAHFKLCCETLAACQLTVNVVNQVHSKLIMADDHVLCVGSYNWASAVREGKYKNMETSVLWSGNLAEEIHLQLDALAARTRQTYSLPRP